MSTPRSMTVVGAGNVTPHMRRVTLAGGDVAAFDQLRNMHVRLVFDGPDGKALNRKYTVRRVDTAAGTIDVDFVLHEDAGPGAAWGAKAAPGDRVGVLGPGGGGIVPAAWYLFIGDETALPAIGRAIETLPAGTQATALIEIEGPAEEQVFETAGTVEIRWLHRGRAAPGTTSLLIDALRREVLPAGHDSIHVWAGVEFHAFQAIRAYLREECGVPKDRHSVVAYWRREPKPSLFASLAMAIGLGRAKADS